MTLPINKDEHRLMEYSTRYMGFEGNILLTDKRLLFYSWEKDIFKGMEYDVIFDVPLDGIIKVDFRGHGLSILIIETDTRRISGNSHHEFFLVDAKKWADAIDNLLKRIPSRSRPSTPGKTEGTGLPGSPRMYHTPSPQSVPQSRRFSKMCLNCMGVVPEGAKTCPRCGNDM